MYHKLPSGQYNFESSSVTWFKNHRSWLVIAQCLHWLWLSEWPVLVPLWKVLVHVEIHTEPMSSSNYLSWLPTDYHQLKEIVFTIMHGNWLQGQWFEASKHELAAEKLKQHSSGAFLKSSCRLMDPKDLLCIGIASEFCNHMESQSPFALAPHARTRPAAPSLPIPRTRFQRIN